MADKMQRTRIPKLAVYYGLRTGLRMTEMRTYNPVLFNFDIVDVGHHMFGPVGNHLVSTVPGSGVKPVGKGM